MPLKIHLDEEPTLNLTAMLDVMFLLIIFFMLGTRFVDAERKIGLKVPEVAGSGVLTAAPSRRVVNVYRDGAVTLDRQPVTLQQLADRLTAARRQYDALEVLVRGDGDDKYQRMVTVLHACKQAGIQNLSIAVRQISAENEIIR
jgi:biopolymer transport protein ExbD